MRDDLERLGKAAARNGRAVEYLRGLKKGVLVCPIPKDATEDCIVGYHVGRTTAIQLLNQYLTQQGLPRVDFTEGLDLLMQAD